jgi:hypothetical protein
MCREIMGYPDYTIPYVICKEVIKILTSAGKNGNINQ